MLTYKDLPYKNVLQKLNLFVRLDNYPSRYQYGQYIALDSKADYFTYFHELAHAIDHHLHGEDSLRIPMFLGFYVGGGQKDYIKEHRELVANKIARHLCGVHGIYVSDKYKHWAKRKSPKSVNKRISNIIEFLGTKSLLKKYEEHDKKENQRFGPV